MWDINKNNHKSGFSRLKSRNKEKYTYLLPQVVFEVKGCWRLLRLLTGEGAPVGPPAKLELFKGLPLKAGALFAALLLTSFLVGFACDSPTKSSLFWLADHPPLVPWPAGTKLIVGSFPLCSAFKLGKFAGARRAVGTFPKLWSPCFWGIFFCNGFKADPCKKCQISIPLFYYKF